MRAGRSAEFQPRIATADPFFLPYVQDWPLDAACPELHFLYLAKKVRFNRTRPGSLTVKHGLLGIENSTSYYKFSR